MIIENYILETKKQCLFLIEAHFDDLLLRIKNNTAFLDEMNATNTEYDVAYVATPPETPCEIPAPEDLPEPLQEPATPNLDEYVEQLKAEHVANGGKLEPLPDTETIERDSEKYLKLVEFSMLKGWTKKKVTEFLVEKGLKMTGNDEDHLDELRKFGAMVADEVMDVSTLLDQNCLSKAEISLLTQKYIF